MNVMQFCHFAMRQGKDKEQIPKGHVPILRAVKVDEDQATFFSLEGVYGEWVQTELASHQYTKALIAHGKS